MLQAYRHKLRASALAAYRHEILVWAALAPHYEKTPDAPELPAIVRD